jgi:RNA polymerase sigma-70 factor (ECF subfamily)
MRMQKMEVPPVVATQEESAVTAAPFRMDFASFYQRELRRAIGLAFVLSGSRSGAEDLAQDAFLKAYKQWETVGAYDNPGAWVRRVVSNGSVSRFRRGKAEAKALVSLTGSMYVVPDMSPDAMATWAAVRKLPKRQAQAIALRYYDRSSIADIARILECPENTVKTHLQRAKQTLEVLLDDGEDHS